MTWSKRGMRQRDRETKEKQNLPMLNFCGGAIDWFQSRSKHAEVNTDLLICTKSTTSTFQICMVRNELTQSAGFDRLDCYCCFVFCKAPEDRS